MSTTSSSDPAGFGPYQAYGLLASLTYLLTIFYTLVYVSPLYFSAATRPMPTRSRDTPEAIRARIFVVSLSTAVCSLMTLGLLLSSQRSSRLQLQQQPLHLMGYWPPGLGDAARALWLTALLFAGPLYESLVVDGAARQWTTLQPLWVDWPTWRNMVAGPVTEECLFRSAAVPLLLRAGVGLAGTIFLSPLVFGLAHLHHFYEFRITHPQTPLPVAIARSVLQLSYTSLFGAYATFLFLRTGSLLAVILVHAFCNCMGLPRFWGSLDPYWLYGRDPAAASSRKIWTAAYYVLLVGGLVAFCRNLYSLTETHMALAEF
ncbi:CAAX prenyl protease [Neonectria magnoliae]|uniref:intramembrane prenyl-peptidase Rce1 n=1 Tax=Neonectria magnoliae TaxID=2732573 RepID=A0ABR1I9K2_9HYPO